MTTQPETTTDSVTAPAGGSAAFTADSTDSVSPPGTSGPPGTYGASASGPYGGPGPDGAEPRWNPESPARTFRMRRSATDKMLLGVCGGIAEHTDIDPVYIRLGFLVSLFWGGIGIFAYLAAALVMPKPLPAPQLR